MKQKVESDHVTIDALKAALVERALSDDVLRPEADHRLVLYRTSAGNLMCLARSGSLLSETPVTVAQCGTDRGCDGVWRCLGAERVANSAQD
ncbi:MAG: hypothetical protein ABW128_11055 [Rhizorhabdus sp.]